MVLVSRCLVTSPQGGEWVLGLPGSAGGRGDPGDIRLLSSLLCLGRASFQARRGGRTFVFRSRAVLEGELGEASHQPPPPGPVWNCRH